MALVFLALCSCVTAAPLPEALQVARIADFDPAWQPLFQGIDLAVVRKLAPDPQAAFAVRIDLKASGIEFLATPSNGDRPAETDGLKTSTFLTRYQCQVAINASPFSPVEEGEGRPKDILGLSMSRGDRYSAPHREFASLLISRDNQVTIAAPPYDTRDAYNAVGGFLVLLDDGRSPGDGDNARHPRTAAGVSKNGRYLYLLVVDGRQGGYSVGATTEETAQWMLQLGAYNAINLDGGGSSALVVSDGQGGATVVNRPIHAGIPGNERVNGNHLGVFAKPLKH